MDQDGFPHNVDCNDTLALVNPNSPEILDGLDNNCNGMIDEMVSNESPAPDAIHFSVFPNPTPGILRVKSNINTDGQLLILATGGQVLHSSPLKLGGRDQQIDLSSLSPGFYIVKVHLSDLENPIIRPLILQP